MNWFNTHKIFVLNGAILICVILVISWYVNTANSQKRAHIDNDYRACTVKAAAKFTSAMQYWCLVEDDSGTSCNSMTQDIALSFATFKRAQSPDSTPATLLSAYEGDIRLCDFDYETAQRSVSGY
ncbi:MAG: hypothetical protein WDN10_01445 [bacterium]